MSQRRISILIATLLLVLGAGVAVYWGFRPRADHANDKNPADAIKPVPYRIPQTIVVQARYPGANASTVADTLAAPIEAEVNGVEHMLTMSSQSGNDGNYRLQVTFAPGTDLNTAQRQVQNRVSQALPLLPAVVQQDGIPVLKKSPEPLMLITLSSPDESFDDLFLGNYANLQIKDELGRVPGVGDVGLIGKRDYRVRLMLDSEKLAARKLTAVDVATALGEQNLNVGGLPIGQIPPPPGQAFVLTITSLGRLLDPAEFENLILKTLPSGVIVRMKDVARIELGPRETGHSQVALNHAPAVALSIYPLPNANLSEMSRAVAEKIAELSNRLPKGLNLAATFDFTQNLNDPKHLVVDVELPDSASRGRVADVLSRSVKILRQVPGVQEVLAFGEQPFSSGSRHPCLVFRLASGDREAIAGTMSGRLRDQIAEAMFQISVPSSTGGFPVYGFPIEFAIEDRGHHGSESLRDQTTKLIEAMSRSGKFNDVAGTGQRSVSFLRLDIDRVKCTALGVDIKEVLNTLNTTLAPLDGNSFSHFGRTWQITIRNDSRLRVQADDIKKLEVKNERGEAIRLVTVMDVRETTGPEVIERHNMSPCARITANLSAGVPLAEAKSLCESLVAQEFDTKAFKLVWGTR